MYRSPIPTNRSHFRAPHGALPATVRGALRPDRGHGGHARSSPTQRVCDGGSGSRRVPGGRVGVFRTLGKKYRTTKLARSVTTGREDRPHRTWGLVATHLPGRTGRECFDRWTCPSLGFLLILQLSFVFYWLPALTCSFVLVRFFGSPHRGGNQPTKRPSFCETCAERGGAGEEERAQACYQPPT